MTPLENNQPPQKQPAPPQSLPPRQIVPNGLEGQGVGIKTSPPVSQQAVPNQKTTQTAPAVNQPPNLPPQPAVSEPTAKNGAKSKLIAAGVLLAVAIIGAAVLFTYKPKIKTEINPQDSTVVIDNKTVSRSKIISTGEHSIEVKKDGFVPFKTKINAKPFNRINLQITLRPLPAPKSFIKGDNAFAVSFKNDGTQFFYLGNKGKTIYSVRILPSSKDKNQINLEKTPITSDNLPEIKSVIFSPQFDLAVFKLKNGHTGVYDFKRYDILNQEFNDWGADIGAIAWSPSGNYLLYYYAPPSGERSLMLSNKAHSKVRRLINLKKTAGITAEASGKDAPRFSWSNDGKSLAIAAQGKLIVVTLATLTANIVVKDGVSSVSYAPDGRSLIYTRNSKLVWQQVKPVNALVEDPKAQANAGKVFVADPVEFNVKAVAEKAVFADNGRKIITISKDGLKEISLASRSVKPFYVKNARSLSQASDLGLSRDGKTLYALVGTTILAVPLDNGTYKIK